MSFGENVYEQASKIIKEKGGRKKMGEEPILELLEGVCDPDSKEGEWLNMLDIVGTKGTLVVNKKSQPGKCGKECKAIVKVCEDIRLEVGESDIAEKLFRGHFASSSKDFATALCNKLTDSCKKPTKLLKTYRVDEKFEAIDSKVNLTSSQILVGHNNTTLCANPPHQHHAPPHPRIIPPFSISLNAFLFSQNFHDATRSPLSDFHHTLSTPVSTTNGQLSERPHPHPIPWARQPADLRVFASLPARRSGRRGGSRRP
jgi:hypothetical protein